MTVVDVQFSHGQEQGHRYALTSASQQAVTAFNHMANPILSLGSLATQTASTTTVVGTARLTASETGE